MCSEGLNNLRNSDLVLTEHLKFSSAKCQGRSKFHNTGKIIPFVFKGANMSLKNGEKRSASIFVKPTTASQFREYGSIVLQLKIFSDSI